jgi:hypothetical protein
VTRSHTSGPIQYGNGRYATPVDIVGGENGDPVFPAALGPNGGLKTEALAGEAHIGQVGGHGVSVRAALNAVSPGVIEAAGDYAANDVLSQAVSNGTGLHWVFTNAARVTGGSGWITKLRATCSVDALVPRLRVWFFDADPSTSEKDDNAAFSLTAADRALCLGYMDLPALADAGAVSFTQNTTDRFRFVCADGSRNLLAIVQTLDAVTNESAGMTLDIHAPIDQD